MKSPIKLVGGKSKLIVDDAPKSDESPHSEQAESASQAKKQVIMNNYGKGVQIEDLNGTLTININ